MSEANEGRRRAMENLSLQMDKYPRDLLQRLLCSSNSQQSQFEDEEESDELELNLGLSLGGRFGVDKSSKNKLIRSSSIAGTMPFVRDDNDATATVSYPAGLMRTSSLPTETEEEWRKRKELQTLRRLEAKRRRSEKQRNSNSSKGEKEEEERRELEGHIGSSLRDNQQPYDAGSRVNRTVRPPFGLPSWVAAAAARQAAFGGGGVDAMAKLKAEILGGLLGFGGQPNSQGSMESQGGSSSGMSELESKPLQGTSSGGEARSPGSSQLLQERSSQDTVVGSSETAANEGASRSSRADVETPSNKPPNPSENRKRERRMNAMEDMPCVFTKGDGPNGRKVEGILYRYGKGEEVRIMCVCHGSFLSPAEFVKHAGGSDVTHPLRHIVVNPAAASFL